MRTSSKRRFAAGGGALGATAIALLLCLSVVPAAPGLGSLAKATNGGATFDLYSMFPQQVLSPATGSLKTFMPLEIRNITGASGEITLAAEPQSEYFEASVSPAKASPEGKDGSAKSRVNVECKPSTPEGTIGWVKVTGTRASETHRIWLKATALSSRPKLEMSMGVPRTGQGYRDQELEAYTGKALEWHVAATNEGGGDDTYKLDYRASFPCEVEFLNVKGQKVEEIKTRGTTRNLLFSRPVQLVVKVKPETELPKNEPQDLTFLLGPGGNTKETAELTVKVLNPGMLFCANDMEGMRPHAHQVMPGETTSFILHVSNLDSSPADIKLTPPEEPGEWNARLDKDTFNALKPGQAAIAKLTVTAPKGAVPGDRFDMMVFAESSLGRSDGVKVAAEVTGERNIYFWSIDSMDPEYLYLDREGTGQGKEGDWLMPNTQAFMKESANYKNARVYLPSATDMNHTNALAGAYTGTQGVYMVGGTYKGFTEHDEVLYGPNTMNLMLFGKEGKPLERVYEVAKRQTGGKSLGGFWSNKNWLAELEGERTVEIVGHSERWPLFFEPPYKYRAAGDPLTDENPEDRLSATPRCIFHSDNARAIVIPTVLGQFDVLFGLRMLATPISLLFAKQPGMHAEDRYITDSFFRSMEEEDPDVCYVNIGDLDNTGHFTGSSWALDEWDDKGSEGTNDDENKYSPWMRRDECLDIAREADVLFGDFVDRLKERGVYDNSVIFVLSDHGMENMKDPKKGYELIDLRSILRDNGYLRSEDYNESGGTEINLIWCDDAEKLANIEKTLEDYTVDDKELGKVKPLTVINRQEMKDGVDFGALGKVRPMELYSEYWINHPEEADGQLWPDLFVFPLYNYQVAAHGDVLSTGINAVGVDIGMETPASVLVGLPGAHGGLQTTRIPMILKVPAGYPGYAPGSEYEGEVEVGDMAPTIYQIMGWAPPDSIDGKPLPSP